jgi:hypothetical protein
MIIEPVLYNCIKLKGTNSTKLSPSWEAASCVATEELPNILWNLKFHYHVHKNPQPVPVLSQFNPVYTTSSYRSKIPLNTILLLTCRSS